MPKIKIKDTVLTVRVTTSFKEDVVKAATVNDMSYSEYVIYSLKNQMSQEGK